MGYSDEQIIKNYLKGDEKSLENLIKKYLKHIYNFIYRNIGNVADAEDITQEVFLKVWKNIRKFDQTKKFKPWLFQIAKNTLIDFFRKKKEISFSRFENNKGQNILLETLAGPSQLLSENIDSRQYLENMIDKLSPKNRAVFSYKFQDGLTFAKISEYLGESINTVKSRYRRALIKLKKIIK